MIMKIPSLVRQIILIFSLIFSAVAYGHTSYPQKIKCPIDGKKFTIWVTGSYTTFNTLKDFQKQGAIGHMYETLVNACPKCHYSGYKSDFDTVFSKSTKQEILKILEPFKSSKLNDVLENEIAAKIYQYLNRDNDAIANLYLVASYLIKEDSAQIDKRKELQSNCASYFIKAIDAKEYNEDYSYATINYLIGELNRRIGDFQAAVTYFDKAIEDPNKRDWILDVAIKQKELAIANNDDNSL